MGQVPEIKLMMMTIAMALVMPSYVVRRSVRLSGVTLMYGVRWSYNLGYQEFYYTKD